MKQTHNKSSNKRKWLRPLLGSISLIDLTLGSLCAGAAMAQGPDAYALAKLSLALLSMGCISLWSLSLRPERESPLTDHGRGRWN